MVQLGNGLKWIEVGRTTDLKIDQQAFDSLVRAVNRDEPNRRLFMLIMGPNLKKSYS